MNRQLTGSAASIASTSPPFKPSPPPLTFHNPTKPLSLAQLRELRMADTIVFALIERAQCLHTDPIHASGTQRPFANQNAAPLPTYAVLHQAHPRLPAALHVARQTCLLSWALAGAPLSHALHPTCTNKTKALYSRPITHVLPALTAPRADPTYIIAYSTG